MAMIGKVRRMRFRLKKSVREIAKAKTPAPKLAAGAREQPFRMLATTLEADPYLGRILTGRIVSGVARPGVTMKALARDGSEIERARITKVLAFRGLKRQAVDEAEPGDIVAIAGFSEASVADTLCALENDLVIPAQPIDPPTLAITISANDSPLAGREGDKVQSRVIRERLLRQAEGDVAIRVADAVGGDAAVVLGREVVRRDRRRHARRRRRIGLSTRHARRAAQSLRAGGCRHRWTLLHQSLWQRPDRAHRAGQTHHHRPALRRFRGCRQRLQNRRRNCGQRSAM